LFNMYMTLGTHLSMYFAPYMFGSSGDRKNHDFSAGRCKFGCHDLYNGFY